ncbi:MAG: PQQ-binding-like beta-propeller repeat protein, partial [Candidatus Brocadiaceae bacterium]|nr:PQQ-binding-like beta-propeller repeat protein [Candidatus Brocadiaceae bacterium]
MKVKSVFSDVKTTLFCLTANALIMSSIIPTSDIYAQDAANSFPMYRYNLQRTGRVPFAGPSNDTLKWNISSSGEIWSSPVVDSDGVIYIGSTDGNLLSITPKGKVLWAFKTADEIFGAPAIGTDGIVYFGSADGRIYAINPDGKLKWKFQAGGAIHSSPAVGDKGTVYVSSYDGKLYAIAANGKL